MHKKDNIFIVWHKSQARVNSMKDDFNYNSFYITSKIKSNKLKFVDYLIKLCKTTLILFKNRPKIVWIQLPPSLILYPVFLYKLFKPKCIFIFDCHNGQFRKPWINFPFSNSLINKISNVIIVHNEDIYRKVVSMKLFKNEKLLILEDNIPEPKIIWEKGNKINKIPMVLFPASFRDDEPVNELIKAAKSLPEFRFVITGSVSKAKLKRHFITESDIPKNVEFTGWVSNQQYSELLVSSDLLLGLTKYNDIQLSVAVEGVGYEKAMVLSNTNTLKKLFNQGAIFVDNTPSGIADGVKKALSNKRELENNTRLLKKIKREKWSIKAEKITELIKKETEKK